MNRRLGRRIAAFVAAIALLASTLVPAHGMGGAGGNPALADVCRSQGSPMPDGIPNGHDTGCAACCVSTAAPPPWSNAPIASSPPFESPAALQTLAAPVAVAGGNARAPPLVR